MVKTFFSLLAILFLHATALKAQTGCPPFWSDIQKFKKSDSAALPPQNAILFVGSSSFTRWRNIEESFPGYTIINRGFGGSQLTDVIRYVYDVILPYAPKQVVIYCGENDLAASPEASAGMVVQRFKTLFGMIRQNLPTAAIHFVSIKPSPSRMQHFEQFRLANAQIRAFLRKQKNAGFINVYNAMLTPAGSPRGELFVEDNLHMNAEGYRIWQKIIQPYLLR